MNTASSPERFAQLWELILPSVRTIFGEALYVVNSTVNRLELKSICKSIFEHSNNNKGYIFLALHNVGSSNINRLFKHKKWGFSDSEIRTLLAIRVYTAQYMANPIKVASTAQVFWQKSCSALLAKLQMLSRHLNVDATEFCLS
jgi:hypothetical protein